MNLIENKITSIVDNLPKFNTFKFKLSKKEEKTIKNYSNFLEFNNKYRKITGKKSTEIRRIKKESELLSIPFDFKIKDRLKDFKNLENTYLENINILELIDKKISLIAELISESLRRNKFCENKAYIYLKENINMKNYISKLNIKKDIA